MRPIFTALSLWTTFFTFGWAQPQVVAEFFLKPSLLQEISAKDTSNTKANVAWANPAGDTAFLSAFLVKTDEGTLQPVVLLKDMTADNLPAIFHALDFASAGVGWQMGVMKDVQLPEGYVDEVLKKITAQPKPAPLFVSIQPNEMAAALNADKKFGDQTATTLTGSLLKEFASVQNLEIRGTPNAQAFRVVTIIKALPETELNAFLNQRLPVTLPDEHSLLPVTKASAYGYACFNAPALAKYLVHLSAVFGKSMPESSKEMLTIAKHLECSQGYASFLKINDEKSPRVFFGGSWNRSNTPEFVLAMYALTHPLVDMRQTETVQAFLLGEAPVWRLRPPASKEKIIPAPAPPQNVFFSVSEGNITQAGSPEALTQLNQDLAPPAIDNNSFSRNFGHLPTLCFQAKYKTESLMQTLLMQTPSSPTPTSLYSAASLGEGQLAVTLDAPYELLGALLRGTTEDKK